MRREDYVAVRRSADPRFAGHQAVAKAELAFALALRRRREALNLSYTQLADATAIDPHRLEAIEEGDGVSLSETLWLVHALGISITVEPDFAIASSPRVALRVATGA